VVFDNRRFRQDLQSSWGYSCLVRGTPKTILFDTGGDGSILLHNMAALGVDPTSIDAVFISHRHWDHTGGLDRVLEASESVPVFVPASSPVGFESQISRSGCKAVKVDRPQALCARVWSCGQIEGKMPEHALVVDTDYGSVILTGCAHPGIVNIVEHIHRIGRTDIALLMGGFHLMDSGRGEVEKIVNHLRRLWVLRLAPSHCTGDEAIEIMRREYGHDFLEAGLGASITV
jgi:7,8-dihydropterin-6-yl-methyl-4-(beta-D-ribofuranosyl)aminobenzene 5'-phosphate synthase